MYSVVCMYRVYSCLCHGMTIVYVVFNFIEFASPLPPCLCMHCFFSNDIIFYDVGLFFCVCCLCFSRLLLCAKSTFPKPKAFSVRQTACLQAVQAQLRGLLLTALLLPKAPFLQITTRSTSFYMTCRNSKMATLTWMAL